MVITEPANYGWPYCATAEMPYNDYDFATGTSGAPFDCAAPVNESPNNTGLRNLPSVEKAEIIYSYGASAAAGHDNDPWRRIMSTIRKAAGLAGIAAGVEGGIHLAPAGAEFDPASRALRGGLGRPRPAGWAYGSVSPSQVHSTTLLGGSGSTPRWRTS